jgi:hypothetical protein
MAVVPFQQYDAYGLYPERVLGYEPGMGMAAPIQYATPGVATSPMLPCVIRGLRFPKIVAGPTGTGGAAAGVPSGAQTLGALFFITIPSSMTTGLTFIIHGTDDGTNPADLGFAALMAIQTKVITSSSYLNFGVPNYATTTPFLNNASGSGANATGPEQSAALTLGATAGLLTTCTIAITTANLGTGAGANSILLCKLRRVGMATADTLQGNIVITGVNVSTY